MDITAQKFQRLLEVSRILSSTLNLSELLHKVMSLATEVADAETSSLLLYDEKTNELVFDVAISDKESQLKEIRLGLDEGIAGWVARERKPQIISDVSKEPRWQKRSDEKINFRTKSLLAVPMLYKGKLLGVIEAINKKKGDFNQEDVQALEIFAIQACVAIENARIFESLQEAKEKIEAVFTQMSDGAIFTDSGGRKLLANKSAEKLLGPESISKDKLPEIFSEFHSSIPLGDLIALSERSSLVDLSRASGKSLYLSGVLNRIFSSKGDLLGLTLIFRDVTEERKDTLIKRNFLSLISHKLKTPLVTVIGYTPLLLSEPTLNDFQKKAIRSIQHQGNNLLSLVEKLLYFSTAESESLSLAKTPCLFSMLVEKSIAGARPIIDEKAATVSVSKDIEKLPPVKMDLDKMDAVLKNLIENALKFSKGNQVHIEIKPCFKDDFAGLAVKDNGPGIPPEERDKIFQKFYQIEESFTGQVEGAGLGLALVKQIVEAHGGSVGLESLLGRGSTFYFLLPVNA